MRLCPIVDLNARIVASPNGAARNLYTMQIMREMINAAKCDPRVINAAHSVIYLQPERDEVSEARALYEYVRDHVRYVKDVHDVETLCTPAMTLQRMVGDCDDQTMLLCALAESCGYPTRLVMAGYHTQDFEHVYCQIFARGQWFDCDPIERAQVFGWSPPGAVSIYIEQVM